MQKPGTFFVGIEYKMMGGRTIRNPGKGSHLHPLICLQRTLPFHEFLLRYFIASQVALVVGNPLPAMQVRSLGREDPLEEEMATNSSIIAWKILWTGKPGGLQFMGSQRVGHD